MFTHYIAYIESQSEQKEGPLQPEGRTGFHEHRRLLKPPLQPECRTGFHECGHLVKPPL